MLIAIPTFSISLQLFDLVSPTSSYPQVGHLIEEDTVAPLTHKHVGFFSVKKERIPLLHNNDIPSVPFVLGSTLYMDLVRVAQFTWS